MKTFRLVLITIASCVLVSGGVHAQWLNYPTPGIPRLPDGKPNLRAPASRTAEGRPDLSGIWQVVNPAPQPRTPRKDFFYDLAMELNARDVVMTPWAQAIQEQRERRDHVDDPWGYCLAPGAPRINVINAPFKIIQTPSVTAMLFSLDTGPTFRQILTDGRPLPDDPEPTWLGYSVGTWQGDTLVITTAGFRDGGWLDTQKGRPHSDALQVTERVRRPSFGTLEAQITIDDPKAYVKPWTLTVPFRLQPDVELLEGSCEGHAKTLEHRNIAPPLPEPPSPRLP